MAGTGGGSRIAPRPFCPSQVKTYIKAHPYPPPLNLITLPLECLFVLANRLRGCLRRRRLRSSSKVDDEPTASQGAGKGGPAPPGPPGLQRQHTKAILAKMEESERKAKHDPYAKSTFPFSKAEAVEDRARQSYLVRAASPLPPRALLALPSPLHPCLVADAHED